MPRAACLSRVFLALFLVACVHVPGIGGKAQEVQVDAVTIKPVGLESLPATQRPFQNRPIELGEGSCAPRVGDKAVGTCIANHACRGYGERDDKGHLQCACFGLRSGCQSSERCDFIKKSCVPIDESPFGRQRAQ